LLACVRNVSVTKWYSLGQALPVQEQIFSYEIIALFCICSIRGKVVWWYHRNPRSYARRSLFEKRDNFFSWSPPYFGVGRFCRPLKIVPLK
jgi:hypothetical protein